jgi:preprotein translocase subunit SecD
MRLSSANVVSAVVQQNQTGSWVVKIRLTPAASATWDTTASRSFHSLLALDVGGKVATAPIIEPAQSSFSSFKGAMEWSAAFKGSTARAIADAAKG